MILPGFSFHNVLFHHHPNENGASKSLKLCDFFFLVFIYLFLAVLGRRYCARALSSCGEWGLLFVAVRGLLIAVASLVAEHRL